MKTSHWFKDAIIYQILIDRFAGCQSNAWNQPNFLGGNLAGIIEKLPYLQDLGVNTLWISPFYETRGYHGYHVTDFFKVDPRYGNTKQLGQLISRVHQAGMHIIADFVPNHCSRHHRFFIQATQHANSRYRNWFIFTRYPDRYRCFLGDRQLPKLNLEHPEARIHIIEAAKQWLSMGLDGYRLDHVTGPTHRFWREFQTAVKRDFPEAILIGEAWLAGVRRSHFSSLNIRNRFWRWLFGVSQEQLQRDYWGELDGVLDFRLQQLLRDHVARNRPEGLDEALKHHYRGYPPDFFLVTFLDNHDMNRFLFECGNDVNRLQAAARIQFGIRQPAVIYYGTETGLTHEDPVSASEVHSDLQARQPMDWGHRHEVLYNFYKDIIAEKKRQLS